MLICMKKIFLYEIIYILSSFTPFFFCFPTFTFILWLLLLVYAIYYFSTLRFILRLVLLVYTCDFLNSFEIKVLFSTW